MGQDEKLREEEQKNYERIVERLQKEKEWILEQTNGQRLSDLIDANINTDSYADIITDADTIRDLEKKLHLINGAFGQLYYAHMKIDTTDRETGIKEKNDIFVGKHGYMHRAEHIIYSWAAPMCWHYLQYNPSIEYTYVNKDKGIVTHTDAVLHNRRDLKILEDRVKEVHEIYSDLTDLDKADISQSTEPKRKVMVDSFLQDLQQRRGKGELQDIIFTIQKEQAEIINCPFDQDLLVQGCAGSGKSMILLHRLPILLYDETHQKLRTGIGIITPSETYTHEIRNLVRDLEIDDIPIWTLEQYYREKIRQSPYVQDERPFFRNMTQANISYQTIENIYSEDMLDYIEAYINTSVRKIPSLSKQLREQVGVIKVNDNNIDQLPPNEAIRIRWNYVFQILEKIYKQLQKEAEPARAIIEDIRKLVKDLEGFADIDIQKDLQGLRRIVEDCYEPNESKGRYDMKVAHIVRQACLTAVGNDQIYRDSAHYVSNALKTLHFHLEHTEKGSIDLQVLMADLRDYQSDLRKKRKLKYLPDDYKNLLEITEGIFDDTAIIRVFLNDVMINISEMDAAIKVGNSYGFTAYLVLWIMLYYRKRPNMDFTSIASDRLLMIDEAQNIMPTELRLLKTLNNKVTLNLFGDFRQHVRSEKGINRWPVHYLNAFDIKRYDINYNYRNCEQITRYCNRKLNMDMKPVSIQGERVQDIRIRYWRELDDVIEKVLKKKSTGNRVAIIFKGDTIPRELARIRDRYDCNVIDMNHSEISKDQVNLVRVRYVKGIEFDEVIVLDSGKMEKEEKYIAYTRALTKLTVIHIGGNQS